MQNKSQIESGPSQSSTAQSVPLPDKSDIAATSLTITPSKASSPIPIVNKCGSILPASVLRDSNTLKSAVEQNANNEQPVRTEYLARSFHPCRHAVQSWHCEVLAQIHPVHWCSYPATRVSIKCKNSTQDDVSGIRAQLTEGQPAAISGSMPAGHSIAEWIYVEKGEGYFNNNGECSFLHEMHDYGPLCAACIANGCTSNADAQHPVRIPYSVCKGRACSL